MGIICGGIVREVPRYRSFVRATILIGLLLVAAGAACAAWAYFESRAVYAAGSQVYDNPIPLLGTYGFGWPGLLILGVGLLRSTARVLKAAGVVCLLAAATPVVLFLWYNFL